MRRVLVTGMSGTGKSTALAELSKRGFQVVETDDGKAAEERALVVSQIAEVEPLLRGACTHEIDATQPIANVVAQLVGIGRGRQRIPIGRGLPGSGASPE